jgi:hypothetical protein
MLRSHNIYIELGNGPGTLPFRLLRTTPVIISHSRYNKHYFVSGLHLIGLHD